THWRGRGRRTTERWGRGPDRGWRPGRQWPERAGAGRNRCASCRTPNQDCRDRLRKALRRKGRCPQKDKNWRGTLVPKTYVLHLDGRFTRYDAGKPSATRASRLADSGAEGAVKIFEPYAKGLFTATALEYTPLPDGFLL